MNMRWDLDVLYTSFDSPECKQDWEELCDKIEALKQWAVENLQNTDDAVEKMEQYITQLTAILQKEYRLFSYAELTASVDAKNEKALQLSERIQDQAVEKVEPEVLFQKWLGTLSNLDELISQSGLLEEHRYFLQEIAEESKYMLSEKEEIILAKMKNTGSNAWTKLQEMLTSTLLVDITIDGEQKQLPLPVVRNMAFEKDADVRKQAYEAELASYKKIEESSAAALNGIKGEVITISKLRGYESALDKTLKDSRMDQETLDAMLTAMRESLPAFQRYFRKKAELLGHQSGLPFYDLFAPVGDADMRFTYQEARDFIVKHFSSFSQKLSDYAAKAFDNRWIDAEIREGKRGGAFCDNLHVVKESRIMANFTGSYSDVSTLGHELGHGYHGDCLVDEAFLNSDYPMPIAETASILCETIIANAALKEASSEEAFSILENDISGAAQVIVDIYSRFLFESELFARRENGSLSVKELNEIMLQAQKDAYGDGLDQSVLHPYMWVCKPHYYSADYNYYNFPYAFGLLFAKGLYAEYLKKGEAFVQQYDELLSVTGKKSVADVAAIMDVDVRSIDFWRNSLSLIEKDIETFISLADAR
ncbi:M3 family oligoendopeptidase [Brevibacillus invocatus]|uniref:M3 family oligoendopeptidase n=1 Tax=Brevibacillus invocatus TaxID=173959 RepID=UPI0005E8D1E2|nr:M3 family oligoendopeptidase [Brevibacillus invocatus]MCM3077794.1 M3 family oligoendopeptidase [Brevibacillus invocatus]MCM3428132.1 M3 family oligoendopeptidase [Brevibacillus invocatus]CFJ33632.1 Oligoendopeptidase F%2C plasmid [Mycobacterium tuberculosis]